MKPWCGGMPKSELMFSLSNTKGSFVRMDDFDDFVETAKLNI